MSKLFKECEWEDDLPTIGTNFRFTKNWEAKKQKKDTSHVEVQHIESVNHQEKNDNQNSTGWSVLLKGNELKVGKRKSDDTVAVSSSKTTSSKKLKPNETGKTNGTTKQKDEPSKESSNGVTNHRAKVTNKEQMKIAKHARENGKNLREKLTERLKGSRFRFINEQLYKMPGEAAKKLFQEDPASFDAYHEGYRQQVEQWPMNPLNRMIKCILKLPKSMIVADFGCGDAKLAASVPNKVYSLDLVANNNSVIACDMANTPLESNFVNVVIFCLSLMGTNLADFFLEANRVLKNGGIMKIAEVSSRFDDVNVFINNVKMCGFALENKDLKHSLFYFFNFKKERTVLKGSTNTKQFSLKPCLYKKR